MAFGPALRHYGMRYTVLLALLVPVVALAQPLTPAAMQEDFCILRAALEGGQPGIYRYTPKPEH